MGGVGDCSNVGAELMAVAELATEGTKVTKLSFVVFVATKRNVFNRTVRGWR